MQNLDLLSIKTGNPEESGRSILSKTSTTNTEDGDYLQAQFRDYMSDIEHSSKDSNATVNEFPLLNDQNMKKNDVTTSANSPEYLSLEPDRLLNEVSENSSESEINAKMIKHDIDINTFLSSDEEEFISAQSTFTITNSDFGQDQVSSSLPTPASDPMAAKATLTNDASIQLSRLATNARMNNIGPVSHRNQIDNAAQSESNTSWNPHVNTNIYSAESGDSLPQSGNFLPLFAVATGITDSDSLLFTQQANQVFSPSLIEADLPTSRSTIGQANTLPVLQSSAQAGSDAWLNEISGQIRYLGKFDIKHAEISLNPVELGSIEIKITSSDDIATVSFISANSNTRELIENSLPRLREMLATIGLGLGESTVSQQHAGNDKETGKKSDVNYTGNAINNSTEQLELIETVVRNNVLQDAGRINLYV